MAGGGRGIRLPDQEYPPVGIDDVRDAHRAEDQGAGLEVVLVHGLQLHLPLSGLPSVAGAHPDTADRSGVPL